MTPQGLSAKAALDADLGPNVAPIDIALGVYLYSEMSSAGCFSLQTFPNPAFKAGVGLADLTLLAYGPGKYVTFDRDLPLYGYAIGQSGF